MVRSSSNETLSSPLSYEPFTKCTKSAAKASFVFRFTLETLLLLSCLVPPSAPRSERRRDASCVIRRNGS
jgi:hypothetical protein